MPWRPSSPIPDRPVIATIGDGAFQMLGINALIDLARYSERWSNKQCIVLVLHNDDLNQVTWEQRVMAGDPKLEVSQVLPDFPYARYAELLGLKGIRVDRPEDVGPAWDEALAHTAGPVLYEAITDPEVPPLPPHIKFEQAKKLAKALPGDPARRRDHHPVDQGQGRGVHHAMSAATALSAAGVEGVAVSAYEIPTDTEHESDGTLVWDSTTIVVVELRCGEHTGLGYTYCDASAGSVIESKLAPVLEDADPLLSGQLWAQMQMEARQLGQVGIAAMAISAVDVALWDLKAKLLGLCLADALPRFRDSVPVYGSGGFCNYSTEQLSEQVAGWAADGFRSVKIKVGRDAKADPERVELVRSAVGDEVEVMVDANGANRPSDAILWAERYRELGVTYFEEPVSSDDLEGLALVRERAPGGLAVAAGEYGWNLPYFQRMLDAGAVHILQADVTRCGGITNLLRIDGLCKARSLPFSAHCAPAISAHVCCAMETVVHLEYFFDHYRIESLLFDGTLSPRDGLLTPDRSRSGLGLELKRADAERYRL